MSTMRSLSEQSGIQFGTSGVRGLVSGLTDELCYAWGQAFLNSVATGAQRIAVGHDLRPSSPRICAAIMQSLVDAGCEPIFIGALPTPALAHYCITHGMPGIMVTGSHIPFDRNGIKFYRADGEIGKDDEQAILNASVNVPASLLPAALPAVAPAALQAYVQRYVQFFGANALSGKRIAVYEHSSVARDVLRTILEGMGAQVLSLGRTDTFVPIDTEAVRTEDVEQALAWAGEHTFDALVSTDGDADRPLIGDENGVWMRGDVVGILCAQVIGAEVVVTPVSSNTAVEKCGSFKQVVRTRIGSPYVIAGMEQAAGKVICGYEANGGFLLGSRVRQNGVELTQQLTQLPTRDSVLPMLALLVQSAKQGIPMSALSAGLPQRFTASDRIQNVPADWSKQLLATLSQDAVSIANLMAPDAGNLIGQDQTDGLRVTFANGDIVHLRPSGNAPELRCYAESQSADRAKILCDACLARVSKRLAQ